MKFSIIIFLSFLYAIKTEGQVSLATLTNVYTKNNLTEAKKALQAIANFKLSEERIPDSLTVNLSEGKLKAYVKHNRTNLELYFTSESLYKAMHKQAAKKLKYENDNRRSIRGNGSSRHTTSFSNYEGARIGSLEITLIEVGSTVTEKVICYELHLFPYHED